MNKSVKIALIPTFTLLLGSAFLATSCGTNVRTMGADYVPDMTTSMEELEGTQITFWTGFGQNINSALQPILDEFTSETGIIVNYESKGGYPNLLSAVNLAASSKKYPNIVNGYGDHFSNYAESHIIMHLDGYIEADKDRDESTVEVIQNMDYNDFYEGYKRENENIVYRANGKGYVLGVPFNKSTEIGTYNRTFFEYIIKQDSTITYPDTGWTWDDVETMGLKIKKVMNDKQLYGKVVGVDENIYNSESECNKAIPGTGKKVLLDFTYVTAEEFKVLSYNSTDNWFITGVRQWGGTYTYVDQKTRRGYIGFDSNETRAFMARMKELFDKGLLGVPKTWEESLYCSNPFKLNKTVINISSTAGVSNSVPDGDKFSVKVCPVPYKDKQNAYVISQGTNLCLLDKGTDKERLASWLLLIYLSQQENANFCIGTGYYPTGAKVSASNEYQTYMNAQSQGIVMTAAQILECESAKMNTEVYDADGSFYKKFVDPAFKGSSYIRETVGSIMDSLFYDSKSIDDIISNIVGKLANYLPK